MNPTVRLGFKKELETNDFPEIETADKASHVCDEILKGWALEQQKPNPKLWKVLGKVFWQDYTLCFLGFLIEVFLKLGEGYFLALLLNWFRDPRQETDGYLYALYLSLCVVGHAIFHHIEFFYGMRVGMQIRVGLTTAVYRKCLKLSTSHTSSTGMIVNLISNDIQRFEDAMPFLPQLIIAPFELVLVTVFLYYQIGISALAAIAGTLALIPMQSLFARFFRKIREVTVAFRDKRIKHISDMLAGIHVVKLYAWEEPFQKEINHLRKEEMDKIKESATLKSINHAIFFSSALNLQLFVFGLFWLLGGQLTPSNVFSSITFINSVQLSMTLFFPTAMQLGSECRVSLERLEQFLGLPEIQDLKSIDNKQDLVFSLKECSFSWTDEVCLDNLTLDIKRGDHLAIVGPVGSGKSSFLLALLREMKTTGTLDIFTQSIAYSAQTPWIISGTVRENILFGQPFDQDRFATVLRATQLDRDISRFPEKEHTILGERGVNLSGGQKARVQLARSLYYNADVYLLDDPFSAVDTVVGGHIFQECIAGLLKNKTVILVTHQVQFASQMQNVMVLERGKIASLGNTEEFKKQADLSVQQTLVELETVEEEKKEFAKEEQAKGSVDFSVYFQYFRDGAGPVLAIVLFLLMIVGQGIVLGASFWLAKWANDPNRADIYPSVFLGLVLGSFAFSLVRSYAFYMTCINSSRVSFARMLKAVFRSPMSFFHVTSHGRLMNRFSKDMNLMDETLPQTFYDFVQCFLSITSIFLQTAIIMPLALAVFPFIGTLFYFLRTYFLRTQRQIKRMESITRSPVYASIPSTLEGLSIIRAFSAQDRFQSVFEDTQDKNTRVYFCYISSGRWLGVRLDLLGSILVVVIAFSVIGLRSWLGINPGFLGLLLSSLMALIGLLQWAVRQSAEVETLMVSTERVFEYTRLQPEAASKTDYKIPDGWPQNGEIDLKNVNLTYPPLGDQVKGAHVLKDLQVFVPGGTKVGIVGRTGAGKSSMLQALFRLVEPDGDIIIDGVNTRDLGLQDLRSRITIIPQEPFCFGGTVRFNLDPFQQYTDEQLWNALGAVELSKTISQMPQQLESIVAENGANWSVGERQLICLARAILRNTRLIVMDEATSSVDLKTDQLVQKAIRSQDGLFAQATVLAIAHRLNTVIDYDRILVLDDGKVVEYGTPRELLSKDGWFSKMVSEMGQEQQQLLRDIAFKTL
ncbi:P-loop containing nucleoside triphosphate hydrolase protein [Gorgonomyces haynaldii]|nr:P-loop containing nucleoside triphosphate hydrolase protein [Gorgonomyces haynaldii]